MNMEVIYFTAIFTGGLIFHYFHDPIQLEITQVSTSLTFYSCLFRTKVLCTISLVTVLLCNLLAKEYIDAKAAHKMMVKLTTSFNFIKILLKTFSYKSALRSFSLISVWLCNFLAKEYCAKIGSKMLMKLTKG